MKATVTLRLKLEITEADEKKLARTQVAYVEALNLTSQIAFTTGVKQAMALHYVAYKQVRAATALAANLVNSARAVVAEAYQREPDKPHRWGKNVAVRYDARTLTVNLAKRYATLNTLEGRVRAALVISNYHQQYLDGSWHFAPHGILKQKNKIWYLHLTAEKEIPDAEGPETLGVDAGINRIATTSTGKVFQGGPVKQIRKRRFRQRRSLKIKTEGQSRSRNQRRLLKRLSDRERRAVEWRLWNVANQIVREAVRVNAGVIAVEDLKHIFRRIRVAKKQRLIQFGWPFASLLAKVRHVASKQGIRVVEVDARNTSKTCSRCGHCDKRNRRSQSIFRCLACGYSHNADYNAAYNIRQRYVANGCAEVNPRRMSAVSRPAGG